MKKLLSLLIYLTLIFSSCKKEDDSPNSGSTNNTPASIIGSWDLTEYHDINTEGYYLGGYPNGTKIITNSADVIMLPGDTFWNLQTLNWTFSTDGYMTETFNDTGIYNMSYEKSENILTIDTNHIWSIITLSSSKLIINSESIDTSTSYWDPNNDTTYFSENSTTIKLDRSSFTTDDTTSKRIQSNKDSFFKTFIDRIKNK
tara:strand:+ start:51 stop:653 length:603 start_codon:yes stop_codon:yes gene_type:complete